MSATAHVNLTLNYEQVLQLVRQLPKKEQRLLAALLSKEELPAKNLTGKEQAFLTRLDEAVDFVNNYPPGKAATPTFKQLLDAL